MIITNCNLLSSLRNSHHLKYNRLIRKLFVYHHANLKSEDVSICRRPHYEF